MPVFTAPPLQNGYGLGSFFRGISALFKPLINLFRSPAVSKTVDILRKVSSKPIVKTIANQAKKEFGNTALHVASDLLTGKPVKNIIKSRGSTALKNIGSEVLKKHKEAKKHKRGKKRKGSIFD